MFQPPRLSPTNSSRKLQALGFIKSYFAQHGASPSLGEIAAALGINRQRVHAIVRQLADDGLIHRDPGQRRGISLPDPAEELSAADAVRVLQALGWTVLSAEARIVGPVTNTRLPLRPALDHSPGVEEHDADGHGRG